MRITFLGTGTAAGVPVYGCGCPACKVARFDARRIRRPSSALLEVGRCRVLLDAGLHDLPERFPPGTLSGILLTHFHFDHVMGLFRLRWGVAPPLPVRHPEDAEGCSDLYKNNGFLRFAVAIPFVPFRLGDITITPVPLIHSKPCLGYCVEARGQRFAYLLDTIGLPPETLAFLREWRPDGIAIDCSHPPRDIPSRNHNDLPAALQAIADIGAPRNILIHAGHELDCWAMEFRPQLPPGVVLASDGDVLEFDRSSLDSDLFPAITEIQNHE
jgi:phosphoribosyl 1,2-cyclic phosphate phosphodiesterase